MFQLIELWGIDISGGKLPVLGYHPLWEENTLSST